MARILVGWGLLHHEPIQSTNHRPVIHVCCFLVDCLGVGMSDIVQKIAFTSLFVFFITFILTAYGNHLGVNTEAIGNVALWSFVIMVFSVIVRIWL